MTEQASGILVAVLLVLIYLVGRAAVRRLREANAEASKLTAHMQADADRASRESAAYQIYIGKVVVPRLQQRAAAAVDMAHKANVGLALLEGDEVGIYRQAFDKYVSKM